MSHALLSWTQVERYLRKRLEQEVAIQATVKTRAEWRMSQGRTQALLEMLKLPAIMAALKEEPDGAPQAQSPRQSWPSWLLEHRDGGRGLEGPAGTGPSRPSVHAGAE